MSTQIMQLNTLTEEQIELLKRTICKGATNDELQLFIHACNRTQLDPFMKQIYAIKRSGVMTIQTAIDGYRLIAERTGRYMPGRESVLTYNSKGEIHSATTFIKKMDSKGEWHEIAATAYFQEYNGNNQMWKKFPSVMLSKCAESLCLRKAFPADMSGLYTEEEMDQAELESKEIEAVPVPEEKALEVPAWKTITPKQAQDIEDNFLPDDSEFRSNTLKTISNWMIEKKYITEPLKDFTGMHEVAFNRCMNTILNRKTERLKQRTDESLQELIGGSDEQQ